MAITLTLTNVGRAALVAHTQAAPFVFNKMKLGQGRSTTPLTQTDITTPFSPAKDFNVAVNNVDRANNQLSFIFVDQDEAATYAPTEIGVYIRNAANTADILIGYASAAAGDVLFTKPTMAEGSVVVTIGFEDVNTTTVTFSASVLNPANDTTTGTVRLVSPGEARVRRIAVLGSGTPVRSLAMAQNRLYGGINNSNRLVQIRMTDGATQELTALPAGNAMSIHGMTHVGANPATATQLVAITSTPATDLPWLYTIATDSWTSAGGAINLDGTCAGLTVKHGDATQVWAVDTSRFLYRLDPANGYRIVAGSKTALHSSLASAIIHSLEFGGDALYVFTSQGTWKIDDPTVDATGGAFVSTRARNWLGTAQIDDVNLWIVQNPNQNRLAIGTYTGNEVETEIDGRMFSAQDIDARLRDYRYLQTVPPESFTEVQIGDGLEGDGTVASPLSIDEASPAEYAMGAAQNKVLTPYATRADGLTEETTGDATADSIEVFDASSGNRRRRIVLRNLVRNVLSRATTTTWGTAIKASLAQARAATDSDAYLTPQGGKELVKAFATDELTEVPAAGNDYVLIGDTSGSSTIKRATLASVLARGDLATASGTLADTDIPHASTSSGNSPTVAVGNASISITPTRTNSIIIAFVMGTVHTTPGSGLKDRMDVRLNFSGGGATQFTTPWIRALDIDISAANEWEVPYSGMAVYQALTTATVNFRVNIRQVRPSGLVGLHNTYVQLVEIG